MGTNHIFYFLQWVTRAPSSSSSWVDKYVEAHVNIAGPLLGTPKALTALLSGEMRDTAELSAFEPVLENFFGRSKRRELFGTWGSLWTLMCKGGNGIWSEPLITFTDSWSGVSKEVDVLEGDTGMEMLRDFGKQQVRRATHETTTRSRRRPLFTRSQTACDMCVASLTPHSPPYHPQKRSAEEFLSLLVNWGGGFGREMSENLSINFSSDGGKSAGNYLGPSVHENQWHNPLAAPLPDAKHMKHYCMYGVGIKTEQRYFYKKNPFIEGVPYVIDTSINDDKEAIKNGVKMGDGDATVPLASMGYMCRSGWVNNPALNPSGSKAVTVEYPNGGFICADLKDPFRSGPLASDHVDIMGNLQLIEDVVKISTGFGEVQDNVVSDIDTVCKEIDARVGEKGGGKVEVN